MPKFVQQFLHWYLNPRGRVGRKWFNIIFLLAFIPALMIDLYSCSEKATQATDAFGSINKMLDTGSLKSNLQSGNVEDTLKHMDETRHSARGMMDVFGIGGTQKGPSTAHFLKKAVELLIYLALIPLIMMRLRDMGKTEPMEIWMFTGFTYCAVILDAFDTFLGLEISFFFSFLAKAVSFFMILWLATSAGEPYTPPSERNRPPPP